MVFTRNPRENNPKILLVKNLPNKTCSQNLVAGRVTPRISRDSDLPVVSFGEHECDFKCFQVHCFFSYWPIFSSQRYDLMRKRWVSGFRVLNRTLKFGWSLFPSTQDITRPQLLWRFRQPGRHIKSGFVLFGKMREFEDGQIEVRFSLVFRYSQDTYQ